jgi:hypothetical protein
VFTCAVGFLIGGRCPLPLHRLPIDRSNVDGETFFLKPSEGSLDVAVVLVTELCHRHPADEVGDISELALVAIAERSKSVREP